MYDFRKISKILRFKIRPIIVKGRSMNPAIQDGQIVWVDYSKEGLIKINIGDILLFKNPQGKNLIIKRVSKIDPNKGYWMTGDNNFPLESTDSNKFGYVKSEYLRGKILFHN
ncbi:MAG: hypothetical protein CMB56_007350 [Methanobacteriota archaeon]|nr:MAG: hypothetical protein CMB56_007350 [Euryarchaeota archaeon]|tara:strand:+ start:43690 stop:44025 length:336 start_codon:yes stop_codon:yes gene_type:complete